MGKKKDENAPIEAVALDPFRLGGRNKAERGEILTLDRESFRQFSGMGRVREATDEDVKAWKKIQADRDKAEKK